jgi:hypothetical protein
VKNIFTKLSGIGILVAFDGSSLERALLENVKKQILVACATNLHVLHFEGKN